MRELSLLLLLFRNMDVLSKNTGFRIVSERYADDEMYGEIYEIAIVCPHDYTVDEIKGYSEQVHKNGNKVN